MLGLLFATVGRPFTPAVIGEVQQDSAAAEAGLQPGDRIVAVDQEPLESFEQLQGIVRDQPDVPLTFTIERDGQTHGRDRHAARDRRSRIASARSTGSG